MQLRYQTTDRDYLALLNLILEGSVFGRRFSRFAWIGISALAWLSVLLPYLKFHELGAGFWTRAAIALLLTLGFPRFYGAYTTGCFAEIINPRTVTRLAGPVVLTVEKEFAEFATQTSTARASWTDIHKIAATDSHLFLFFTPLVAAPIPRSACASDEAFRELRATLERWWTAARSPA